MVVIGDSLGCEFRRRSIRRSSFMAAIRNLKTREGRKRRWRDPVNWPGSVDRGQARGRKPGGAVLPPSGAPAAHGQGPARKATEPLL
jgi:hypothetical protein